MAGGTLELPPLAPSQPSLPSVLWLYFLLLGTSVIGILVRHFGDASESQAMVLIVSADTVLVALWLLGTYAALWPILARTAAMGWYAVAAGLACGTAVIAALAVRFLVQSLQIPEIHISEPLLKAGWGWGGVIAMVCLQPAVVEEIAFRGVVLTGLQNILSRRDAVIVSALMFAILHLSVLSLPHLFLIGLALGWLRIRTGSLYPGMAMHFTHNLLVVLAESAGL
jgi:membrane protease YdiL (CAAX protease family)